MERTIDSSARTSALAYALAGLIVAAMLLRIGLVLLLPRVITGDEAAYLLLGRSLLAGQGFTVGSHPEVHHTPLYPLVVGTLYRLVGDPEWASDLAYVLFGGLLPLPVFVIARRIYGKATAWLGAVFLATVPALSVSVLYWGSMTEPLYLCLVYTALAVLLVGLEEQRLWLVAGAGALFGLAYLTRPEAICYAGVFFLVALAWLARHGGWHHVPRWRALGGFILLFILLAAPYIWYLHAHTGRWMLTGKLGLTWEWFDAQHSQNKAAYIDRQVASLDAAGRELIWGSPDRFQRSLWQLIWVDPKGFAGRVLINVRELKGSFFDRDVFWLGLLPLVFIAWFQQPWDGRRLSHEMFLFATLVPLLAYLVFHIEVRFFTPAFPVLLLWTARGALDLGQWLADTLALSRGKAGVRPQHAHAVRALPAALVVLFFVGMVPLVARARTAGLPTEVKEVGHWLRMHTPADTKVMSHDPAVAVYAERGRIPSPHTDWACFVGYGRAHEANYLVVNEWELTKLRPHLAFLMDPGRAPPEVEPLFSAGGPKCRTLVYRFQFGQNSEALNCARKPE